MLDDGHALLLEGLAEVARLVLDDAVEEERDVLLAAAGLADVEEVVDDLSVPDEAGRDGVRLGVPDHVPVLEEAVRHFLVDELGVLLQERPALLVGRTLHVLCNKLDSLFVQFSSHFFLISSLLFSSPFFVVVCCFLFLFCVFFFVVIILTSSILTT